MDARFKEQVIEIINLIPKGRVTTYGAIAKAIGYPNHARQVGNTFRGEKKSYPAHRVCNASGIITASGQDDFKLRLEREGVKVTDDHKIQDFKKLFWDPLEEI